MQAEGAYPGELRADFQQFYNLNIDDMGVSFSYAHAACLLQQLPHDSRIARAQNPNLAWSVSDWFLSAIEYDLRVLIWSKTKQGRRGVNKPKPAKTPAEQLMKKKRLEGTERSIVDAVLNGDRKNG